MVKNKMSKDHYQAGVKHGNIRAHRYFRMREIVILHNSTLGIEVIKLGKRINLLSPKLQTQIK